MKFIFVDEIQGEVDKKLFGISLLVIDSSKYNLLHEKFAKTLEKLGWPLNIEIKGKYLFSRNPEGTGKKPEEMIDLIQEIINYLSSDKNARGSVYFIYNHNNFTPENYIHLLNHGLKNISKPQDKKNSKNLAAVFLDESSMLRSGKIKIALDEAASISIANRGFVLVESQVSLVRSNNKSVGTCYSDIIAYISRWVVENKKEESKDQISLFELYDDEDAKKIIQTSKINKAYELSNSIKNIKFIELR